MDTHGSTPRRWSTGIAFQLLLGLGVLVLLILITGISALAGLHQLMRGLQTVAHEQIEELVLATQVDRQSAILVAEAPNLALADSEAQRRYSLRRLQDQLQLSQKPSQRLSDMALVDPKLISDIDHAQEQLRQNILALNDVVRQRNTMTVARYERIVALDQRRQQLSQAQAELYRWQQHQQRVTPAEDTHLSWRWLHHAQEALALEGIIFGIEQGFRLPALSNQYQALQREQQRLRTQLSTPDWQRLGVAPSALDINPSIRQDPVVLQRQVLGLQQQIQGMLAQNSDLADTLLAATANLVERVEQAIDAQNQRNRLTIEHLYNLGLAAMIVALGLALLVLRFMDRRVFRRLRHFQQSLQILTEDPGKIHTIPVVGQDEIAAMARSFEGLLAVIRAREQTLRDNEQRLQTLARQDTLTGLPNRHYFFEMAQREIYRSTRQQHPLAVLMLDVDHFKAINDSLGHAAGDQVLSTLGQALTQLVRGQDVVGRLGGEEFAILLPGTDHHGAMELAERLRAGIADLDIRHAGHVIPLTVSIGVAEHRADDPAVDHALSCADHGLYRAKRAGRNRVMAGLAE